MTIRSIHIVTKVPEQRTPFIEEYGTDTGYAENDGNLCAPLGENFYMADGNTQPMTYRKLAFHEQMFVRVPVFYLGELLFLDGNDRDQFGRKPSKWSVEIEYVGSIDDDNDLIEKFKNLSREPKEQV